MSRGRSELHGMPGPPSSAPAGGESALPPVGRQHRGGACRAGTRLGSKGHCIGFYTTVRILNPLRSTSTSMMSSSEPDRRVTSMS